MTNIGSCRMNAEGIPEHLQWFTNDVAVIRAGAR
jgi:hypothetical protein